MKFPKVQKAEEARKSTLVGVAKNKSGNKDKLTKLNKGTKHAINLVSNGVLKKEIGDLVNIGSDMNIRKKKKRISKSPKKDLNSKLNFGTKANAVLLNKSPVSTGTNKELNSSIKVSATSETNISKKKRKSSIRKSVLPINSEESKSPSDIKPVSQSEIKGNKRKSILFNVSEETSEPPSLKEKRKSINSENVNLKQETNPKAKRKSLSALSYKKDSKNISVKEESVEENKSMSITFEDDAIEDEQSKPSKNMFSEELLQLIRALISLLKKRQEKPLLAGCSNAVFLQIDLLKIPVPHKQIIRFPLKYSLAKDDEDVCLFVRDIMKGDIDGTVKHYKEFLRKNGVSSIKEVIPLKALRSEYSQFEDKRKLSFRFETFLVDSVVLHRVFKMLGKPFHQKRKTPIPLNLDKENLKDEVSRVLRKTMLVLKGHGNSITLQVGHSDMTEEQIKENIESVCGAFDSLLSGGWGNIRSLSIKTERSASFAIYKSLQNPNNVVFPPRKNKKTQGAIEGELSTQLNKTVIVYPSGNIILKKNKKGENKISTLRAESAEKVAPSQVTKKKKKQKKKAANKKVEENVKKEESEDDLMQKSSDEGSGEEEPNVKEASDSEFDVEEAEEMYLQELSSQRGSKRKAQSEEVISKKKLTGAASTNVKKKNKRAKAKGKVTKAD